MEVSTYKRTFPTLCNKIHVYEPEELVEGLRNNVVSHTQIILRKLFSLHIYEYNDFLFIIIYFLILTLRCFQQHFRIIILSNNLNLANLIQTWYAFHYA